MYLLPGAKAMMANDLQATCLSLSSPPKFLHEVFYFHLGQEKTEHCHKLNKDTQHFAQLPTLQKMPVV